MVPLVCRVDWGGVWCLRIVRALHHKCFGAAFPFFGVIKSQDLTCWPWIIDRSIMRYLVGVNCGGSVGMPSAQRL
jgi:hypothetical protein